MKTILVTGSLAFDHIMDFPETFEENILPDKLHTLSVSFLVRNFGRNFGGVAGNIAFNLGLLEERAAILASAGDNDFAPYNDHLCNVAVVTQYVNRVRNEFSANFFVITDSNNCQIAGFYAGAMVQDTALSIHQCDPCLLDFLLVSPTMPDAMDAFVREAKQSGIPYLYSPAQQIPRLSPEQLRYGVDGAEILIGNDYELSILMKKAGLSKRDLLRQAKIVVTTLGADGSTIEVGDEAICVGVVPPAEIVDPTGAGDAYIAGFLRGYLRHDDLRVCGQLGATAASYALEKYGTQNHAYTLQDFASRYTQAFEPGIRRAVGPGARRAKTG